MNNQLDDVDKLIIYRLMEDARNTTAPEIANEVNVSPGTIRNRIKQLEKNGIIKGYHADINFSNVGKRLINIFKCSSPIKKHPNLGKKALQIPGVINVRKIMSGEENLYVKAVAESIEEITEIANELEDLGIEISDEDLLQEEHFQPYYSFGPEEEGEKRPIVNLKRIKSGVEAAEISVGENVPVEGKTVEEIKDLDLLEEDVLLLAVERGDETITPQGKTVIKRGDIVSVFSPHGISSETIRAFTTE